MTIDSERVVFDQQNILSALEEMAKKEAATLTEYLFKNEMHVNLVILSGEPCILIEIGESELLVELKLIDLIEAEIEYSGNQPTLVNLLRAIR